MSVEFKAEVSLNVACATCGKDLEATIGGKYSWSEDTMKVEPCTDCMESAAQKGRQEAEESAR